MRLEKQRITCHECKQVNDIEIPVEVPVAVAVAALRGARCPNCDSSRIYLGGNYADAPAAGPLDSRIAWWELRGEHGLSSMTIFRAFTGRKIRGGVFDPDFDVPYDPADYNRCRRLLELIPEWRADLGKVAEVYPAWKPFVDRWAEFEALWAEESPSDRCEKLYELMQVAVKESHKIRNASSPAFPGKPKNPLDISDIL